MKRLREESEKKESSLLRVFSIIVIVVLLLSVCFVSFQFFAPKSEIVAPGPYPQPSVSSTESPLVQAKTERD